MAKQTKKSKAGDIARIENKDEFVFDMDTYNDVAHSARLRDVKLIESKYYAKPELVLLNDDEDAERFSFEGSCTSLNFNADKGFAFGDYEWTAEVKVGRKNALKFTVKYLVMYSDLAGKDEDHVFCYFEKVGRFTTYPYFRAAFSHHVADSRLSLPPLPTLTERVD